MLLEDPSIPSEGVIMVSEDPSIPSDGVIMLSEETLPVLHLGVLRLPKDSISSPEGPIRLSDDPTSPELEDAIRLSEDRTIPPELGSYI